MLYVLILDYEMTKRFRKVKYKREDYLLRLKGDEMQIESGRGCFTYTSFFLLMYRQGWIEWRRDVKRSKRR